MCVGEIGRKNIYFFFFAITNLILLLFEGSAKRRLKIEEERRKKIEMIDVPTMISHNLLFVQRFSYSFFLFFLPFSVFLLHYCEFNVCFIFTTANLSLSFLQYSHHLPPNDSTTNAITMSQ